jgi:AhpD family alkylhydroperoxidase
MNASVRELVAIAAAMAGNCEPCFRNHYDKARNLGVSQADIREAVDVALAVKATPHRKVVETAERCLASQDEPAAEGSDCGCGTARCC